jgi:hypothetical protein
MRDCFHGNLASHPADKAGRYHCMGCNRYWCKACVEQAATASAASESADLWLRDKVMAAAKFANGACPGCQQPNIAEVTGVAMLR